MIKLSGSDWKAFYGDPKIWGDPTSITSKYHDDFEIQINGRPQGNYDDLSKVQNSDIITVKAGKILSNADCNFEAALVQTLRAWLKARTHQRVVLDIPMADRAKLVKLAKTNKWRMG